MDPRELAEAAISLLWDATKEPGEPLWWCLRDDLKQTFRERAVDLARQRERSRIVEHDALVRDLSAR